MTTRYLTLTLITALSCSNVDASPIPLAHYSLDGHAKDTLSFSPEGNIYNVTPTKNRCGLENRAMKFNGEDSYIRIQDNGLLAQNEFRSVCVWAKLEEKPSNSYHAIIAKHRSDSPAENGYLTSLNSNEIRAWVKDATYEDPGKSLPFYDYNVWNHYCTVISTNSVKFYINGFRYKTSIQSTNIHPQTPADFLIGATLTARSQVSIFSYTKGAIDDVTFWKEELTPYQVQSKSFEGCGYPSTKI